MSLSASQARVVGSLIEKQLTTPQQYPLTANALLLACNQASNRAPVVSYTEDQVMAALDELRAQRLVRFVLPSHGRSVVRYRHVLDEVLGVDVPQLALLAVLLLRGAQTPGELRIRTERMATFDSLGAVERDLVLLADREVPLVVRLPRRPGQKEERWAELLRAAGDVVAGDVVADDVVAGDDGGTAAVVPSPPTGGVPTGGVPTGGVPTGGVPTEDVPAGGVPTGDGAATSTGGVPTGGVLAAEVAALREEVAALRVELEALRSSLGG